MGVPFEALIPYGIVVAVRTNYTDAPPTIQHCQQLTMEWQMIGVTGAGLSVVKHFANDGKKARWNLDTWDRVRFIHAVEFGTILANIRTAK